VDCTGRSVGRDLLGVVCCEVSVMLAGGCVTPCGLYKAIGPPAFQLYSGGEDA
jgi:hypothetical protein